MGSNVDCGSGSAIRRQAGTGHKPSFADDGQIGDNLRVSNDGPSMTNTELIDSLVKDVRSSYGCHTAILYGSRARDDWEATSDIDVVAFRDVGGYQRVASRWKGVFLDLFVHSTDHEPDPSWIRFNGGRVLFQTDGFADKVLSDVQALFDEGPEQVPASELQVRKIWAEKMLERATKGDAEGNYRRHGFYSRFSKITLPLAASGT